MAFAPLNGTNFQTFFTTLFFAIESYIYGTDFKLGLINQLWQPAAKSTAERVQLFTESTRVYGNYFAIIEQCTVETKTII